MVSSSVVSAQDPQRGSLWARSYLSVPGVPSSLLPMRLRVGCLFCLQSSVLQGPSVLVIHPVLSRKFDSHVCSFSSSFRTFLPALAAGGVHDMPAAQHTLQKGLELYFCPWLGTVLSL